MNGNFNVKEFSTLQANASSIFNEIVENISSIQRICNEIGGTLSSDDSSIAGDWNNISRTLSKPIESASLIFTGIKDEMANYAAASIADEEKYSHNMTEYNNGINKLAAAAALIGANGASSIASKGLINNENVNNVLTRKTVNANGEYTDSDGTKHVWDPETGGYYTITPDGKEHRLVQNFSNDGKFNDVLTRNTVNMNGEYTDSNGTKHAWDPETGGYYTITPDGQEHRLVQNFSNDGKFNDVLTRNTVNMNGEYTDSNGTKHVWDPKTGGYYTVSPTGERIGEHFVNRPDFNNINFR